MKPSWAGEESVWRDHWMQSVYYNPRPIQLTQGTKYCLQSFHDEYSFWFNIGLNGDSLGVETSVLQHPPCTCGVHSALSRSRFGLFNDRERQEKYVTTLGPFVTKESVCLVLSEGSVLPFLLAGLGARKVYVHESNGWSKRAMGKLVDHAGLGKQIILLDNIRDDTLAGLEVLILEQFRFN